MALHQEIIITGTIAVHRADDGCRTAMGIQATEGMIGPAERIGQYARGQFDPQLAGILVGIPVAAIREPMIGHGFDVAWQLGFYVIDDRAVVGGQQRPLATQLVGDHQQRRCLAGTGQRLHHHRLAGRDGIQHRGLLVGGVQRLVHPPAILVPLAFITRASASWLSTLPSAMARRYQRAASSRFTATPKP